ERFLDVDDAASLRRVVSGQIGVKALLRVAVGVIRAELNALEKAFWNGVRDTELPVGVADLAGRGRVAVAAVMTHIEMTDVPENCPSRFADRVRRRRVDVERAVGLALTGVRPRAEVIGQAIRQLDADPLP